MIRTKLIAFYSGNATDHKGRYLQDIWLFSHKELENSHNYIQWLFPLEKKSLFNLFAETHNKDSIIVFKNSMQIRNNMISSLKIMLEFYGFEIINEDEQNPIIKENEDFKDRSKIWLKPKNHNYSRITRIIKSLKLAGLTNYANAVYDVLMQMSKENRDIIGEKSLKYWKNAITL